MTLWRKDKTIDKWSITDWLNQYIFEQKPIPELYELISERAIKAGQRQFRDESSVRAHFKSLSGKRNGVLTTERYEVFKRIIENNNEYKTFMEGKRFGLKPKNEISFNEGHGTSDHWTDEELVGVINAYFQMLGKEQHGQKYHKKEYYSEFSEAVLPNRRKGSVEFMMQNISAVLQELCHPFIQRYLPRGNVGADVSQRIKEIIFREGLLNEEDYTPTHDEAELDNRVASLLKRGIAGEHTGNEKPKKIKTSQVSYERDPIVKALVQKNSNGRCELCGKNGPFVDKYGFLFLEVHHVVSLADGGSDTIHNAVALCPNCHRKCHYSENVEAIVRELRNKVERIQ